MNQLSLLIIVVEFTGTPAKDLISNWHPLSGPFVESGSYAEVIDLPANGQALLAHLSSEWNLASDIPESVLNAETFQQKIEEYRLAMTKDVALLLFACGNELDRPWIIFAGHKLPCIGHFQPCSSSDILSTALALSGKSTDGNFLLADSTTATGSVAEAKLLERLRDLYGE